MKIFKTFKIFSISLLVSLSLSTARAQMGWTLAQCRQHFGHELKDVYTEPGEVAFGIKYRGYTREENLNRDAPAGAFDGVRVRVKFDSDGTVGTIQWEKSGAFEYTAIEPLLKTASAVFWRPVPGTKREWNDEGGGGQPSEWVGERHGATIFDAVETFDDSDGGHDFLSVSTRPLAQRHALTEAEIDYEEHYAFVLFGFKDSEANGVKPAEPGRHYYMSFISDCLNEHGISTDTSEVLRFRGDVDKMEDLPSKGNADRDFFRTKDHTLWVWGPNGFFHCVPEDIDREH
jgi:hypothetical protein